MGQLTYSMKTDADPDHPLAYTGDIADADIGRIITAFRVIKGVPAGTADAEVVHLIIQDSLDRMLGAVQSVEAGEAATAAAAAVARIVVTAAS